MQTVAGRVHTVCLGHVILDWFQPLRHLGKHSLLLRLHFCVLLRTLWLHVPRHRHQRHGHRDLLVHGRPGRDAAAGPGCRVEVLPIVDTAHTCRPHPAKAADYDKIQVEIGRSNLTPRVDALQPAFLQSVGVRVCSRGRLRGADHDRVDDADSEASDFDRKFPQVVFSHRKIDEYKGGGRRGAAQYCGGSASRSRVGWRHRRHRVDRFVGVRGVAAVWPSDGGYASVAESTICVAGYSNW